MLIAMSVCMTGDYQENHNTDKLGRRYPTCVDICCSITRGLIISINVMYMYILANLNLYFCRTSSSILEGFDKICRTHCDVRFRLAIVKLNSQ